MEKVDFSAILLDNGNYKEYKTHNEEDRFIRNISRVNILVGVNSSGKSRLIRKMFVDEDLKFLSGCIDLENINKKIEQYKSELEKVLRQALPSSEYSFVSAKLEKFICLPCLTRHTDFSAMVNSAHEIWDTINRFGVYTHNRDKIKFILEQYLNLFNEIAPNSNGVIFLPYERIYIPTLRGLRPIQISSSENNRFDGKKDNYKHRTNFDYFKKTKNDNIFTGLSFYDDLDEYYRGDSTRRALLKNFEIFLSKTFFNNLFVELIPTIGQDVVNVKIGNHEYPIFHLGDGIQQIIILTYPLFFKKGKNLKVFYEEPDSNLHPGFQRIFLETLMREEFSENQYFITTHSNHFLDMTIDRKNISIYSCEQIGFDGEHPTFIVSNIEGPDSSILSILGVKNSSVFLSNCTIWVEGISDRIYLRRYIALYQKANNLHFMEDTHFSFVEYGGNNITHWSFLDDEDPEHANIFVDRLCGKLFLVTDSDNAGFNKNGSIPKNPSKKSRRFEQLKDKLEERFYCLKCREIENLLTPKVLASVVSEYEDRLIDADSFAKENYSKARMGSFIEEQVSELKKSYSTDSGSIQNKVGFSKKAVSNIHSLGDMSGEAISLAELIVNFIKTQNC